MLKTTLQEQHGTTASTLVLQSLGLKCTTFGQVQSLQRIKQLVLAEQWLQRRSFIQRQETFQLNTWDMSSRVKLSPNQSSKIPTFIHFHDLYIFIFCFHFHTMSFTFTRFADVCYDSLAGVASGIFTSSNMEITLPLADGNTIGGRFPP